MKNTTHEPLPAGLVDATSLPWQPIFPGFTLQALRATRDGDARALILKLEPGTLIPRHRHTGDVHAYNLSGQRLLVETNEIVGPGGYVYEPAGNVDSWMAVGDEPCVVFVVAQGAVEYLDDEGRVLRRSTTSSTGEAYRTFCKTTR